MERIIVGVQTMPDVLMQELQPAEPFVDFEHEVVTGDEAIDEILAPFARVSVYSEDVADGDPTAEEQDLILQRVVQSGIRARNKLSGAYVPNRRELLEHVQRGDVARDELISNHLPHALSMAKAFARKHPGMEVEDVFQDAMVGLIHAIETFDYNRHLYFSTHARDGMFRSIVRSYKEAGRTVRIPREGYEDYALVLDVRHATETSVGRALSDDDFSHYDNVASSMGMTPEEVRGMLGLFAANASLESLMIDNLENEFGGAYPNEGCGTEDGMLSGAVDVGKILTHLYEYGVLSADQVVLFGLSLGVVPATKSIRSIRSGKATRPTKIIKIEDASSIQSDVPMSPSEIDARFPGKYGKYRHNISHKLSLIKDKIMRGSLGRTVLSQHVDIDPESGRLLS